MKYCLPLIVILSIFALCLPISAQYPLDEFMLFHRALTEKEVEHLASGPENPFAVDPKGKLSTTWGYIKDIQ